MKNLLLRNMTITIISNILSAIISLISVLILPRHLSVVSFGLWQIFLFYSTYIAYTSFGITDGVYINYGGWEYENLPQKKIRSQFWLLVLVEIILIMLLFVFNLAADIQTPYSYIYLAVGIGGLFSVPRSLLTFVLKTTNLVKESSMGLIIERLSFLILSLISLLSSEFNFKHLIYSDLLAKLISNIYLIIINRRLVFGSIYGLKRTLAEASRNIGVGLKILTTNILGILIIGLVRFVIELKWNVQDFAKISLSLSINNMFLLFFKPLEQVLFPILNKLNNQLMISYYQSRYLINAVLYLVLLGYFPIKFFLVNWLVEYSDSVFFMIILLPAIIFEGKLSLYIIPILQSMRKETLILKSNIFIVSITAILLYVFVKLQVSLVFTVSLITVMTGLKAYILEYTLSKILKVSIKINILVELIMIIFFVYFSMFFNECIGFFIFIINYVIYLTVYFKDIKETIHGILK